MEENKVDVVFHGVRLQCFLDEAGDVESIICEEDLLPLLEWLMSPAERTVLMDGVAWGAM